MKRKILQLLIASAALLSASCRTTINLTAPESEGAVLVGRFERYEGQRPAPWIKMDSILVAHACLGEVFGVGRFKLEDEKGFFAVKLPREIDGVALQVVCNGGGQGTDVMSTKIMDLQIAAKPGEVFLVPTRELHYGGAMSLLTSTDSIKARQDEKSNQEIIEWVKKEVPAQAIDLSKVTVLK